MRSDSSPNSGRCRPAGARYDSSLELGCGHRHHDAPGAEATSAVDAVGVDLSLASLRANVRYKTNPFLHFVQGSVVLSARSPSGTFDTVYSRGVFHHTYLHRRSFSALASYAHRAARPTYGSTGRSAIDDNALRRGIVHWRRRRRARCCAAVTSGVLANAILVAAGGQRTWLFNYGRRLREPTIQPLQLQASAARRTRPALRPSSPIDTRDAEVLDWFRRRGISSMSRWSTGGPCHRPTTTTIERNTGVRGERSQRTTASEPVVRRRRRVTTVTGDYPMCGIHGILPARRRTGARRMAARAWARVTVHRGPDDEGVHVDGRCAIGMRRLSIIDLAGGHQPICERRRHARGWSATARSTTSASCGASCRRTAIVFRTGSDSEVLLHLYAQWGDEFVERLNGMFGFALWDARAARLLVGRDRLGIKPLYWLQRRPPHRLRVARRRRCSRCRACARDSTRGAARLPRPRLRARAAVDVPRASASCRRRRC